MRGRPKKEKSPIPSLKELLSRGDLISPEELSQALRVAQVTIYQWVRRGVIPYMKLEALVRFDPQEIQEWLSEGKRRAARESAERREAAARKSASGDQAGATS